MGAIAGVFGVRNAAKTARLLLFGLQHRGQDAAGIASVSLVKSRDIHGDETFKETVHDIRGIGLVDEAFAQTNFDIDLPGTSAIGHLRRTTDGTSDRPTMLQPLMRTVMGTDVALAHAGRLTNDAELRERFGKAGAIFTSKDHAETIMHATMRSSGETLYERLISCFAQLQGAWTIAVLGPDAMIAAVDPFGYRPLMMAPYQDGIVLASETCALDLIDAGPWQAVEPGTAVIATPGRVRIDRFSQRFPQRRCSFEHVYYSRPDSFAFGDASYDVRLRLGQRLARGETVRPDVVLEVPDSSSVMAAAYAHALGVPNYPGLIRNHYAGRTRSSKIHREIEMGVRMKLNAVPSIVRDKVVTVVDDSLIRGETVKKLVDLLQWARVKEVHVRIASPMIVEPCGYGVNESDPKKLIAANHPLDHIRERIGADSLRFLELHDLQDALGPDSLERYCTECFGGAKEPLPYHVPVWKLRRD